jgi:error-prone DNA polymerase
VAFIRKPLAADGVTETRALRLQADGTPVRVAGLVLVRQRPGTAKNICFITLEDETGIANLVVFKNKFEQYRREILGAKLLMAEGKLQKEGEVIHVVVQRIFDYSALLMRLNTARDSGQKKGRNKGAVTTVVQGEIFPKGRNFK